MRRIAFKKVLDGVATRLAVEPGLVQTNQAAALAAYIQDRLQAVWELYNWPFTRATEARVFYPRWDDVDAAELVMGDIVFHEGAYWTALVNASAQEPMEGANEWEVATNYERVISFDQPGQTPISEVLGVSNDDPEVNEKAGAVNYVLSGGGIAFGESAPAEVWVTFSRRAPEFTVVPWSAATNYVAGDLVYYAAAQDCFRCAEANVNTPPPTGDTSNAHWTRQEFPHELGLYVKHGAKADALEEDNNVESAYQSERRAQKALEDELEKLLVKQGQVSGWDVRTQ